MERTLLSLLVYSLPFDVCHFEQFFHRIRDTVYPPLAGSQLSAKTESSDLSIDTKQPSNLEISTPFSSISTLSSLTVHSKVFIPASRRLSEDRERHKLEAQRESFLMAQEDFSAIPPTPPHITAESGSFPPVPQTKSLDVAHYFYPLPQTLSYSLFRYRSYGSVQQTLLWGNNGSPPPASSPNDPEGLTGSFFFTDKQSSLPPVTHPTTTSFAFPLAHLLQMKGIQPSSYLFPTLPPSLAVTPPVGTSVSPVFFSPTQPAPSPATLANPTAPRTPTQLILPCGAGEDTGPACSAHLGTAAIEPQQPRAAPPLSPEEHRRLDRTDAADVLRSSSAAPPPYALHGRGEFSASRAEASHYDHRSWNTASLQTPLVSSDPSISSSTVAWTDTALPNITPHPPALHKTRCRSQSISGLAARAGSTTLGGPPAGRAHPTHKADHSQFTVRSPLPPLAAAGSTRRPEGTTPPDHAVPNTLHTTRPSPCPTPLSSIHRPPNKSRMLSLPRQSTPHSCAPPLKSAIDLVGTKWGGKK
ncbi:hypothetical protein BLNAU_7393 [Blattamonas nauphoetae]|uniref:Uncharacterized protein n=1 Tax=Blattamonas nauphoetae TaxID=2049346 RepID=A0ABQ9Y186_9EUKA|nr:hypothetical protein BLNAU_7393 [Blattamonas nauphoetae]